MSKVPACRLAEKWMTGMERQIALTPKPQLVGEFSRHRMQKTACGFGDFFL
jgi:hypothetical protein